MAATAGSWNPVAVVRRETIANTVATAVIAALLTFVLFRGQAAIPALAPPPGGIFGIVPGTFNFTLLVTIVLSLVIRGRVTKGAATRVAQAAPSRLAEALPANLLLRAIALAALTTVLFVPVTYALVWLAGAVGLLPVAWSFAGMLAFFTLYFVLVSLFVTPVIVWRALRD